MNRRFDGQVAMVFGAARRPGIGRETARLLAREGAAVACIEDTSANSRDDNRASSEELRLVLESVTAEGVDSIGIELDFTEADSVDMAVTTVAERWGHVDAGACLILQTGPELSEGALVDIDPGRWRDCIERNLTSTWLANRALARQMIRQSSGTIVNLSSEGTRAAPVGHGAYVVAKAGVEMMTRVLARELGRHGVRINAVSPLAVFDSEPSPGVQRLAQGSGMTVAEWLDTNVPLGRQQSPLELAACIACLLCGETSFVTGETLYVTGGAM